MSVMPELTTGYLHPRIGTANGVGFYERPPESIRAEELEPPVPGAQRLWDGNTDVDAYEDVPQPGRSRPDIDYSEGSCPCLTPHCNARGSRCISRSHTLLEAVFCRCQRPHMGFCQM